MPTNFLGVVAAFTEPVLHAWSNILDNYFSNNVFPRLTVLLFFGTALNFIFIPFLALVSTPEVLGYATLSLVFLIAAINVLYQFPYYWALRHTDTSIVASLFMFGKIFVPILAFAFIGERLALTQYLGFFCIVVSTTLLTLDFKNLRFNRAFFLMLGATFMLAVQTILYKYVFEGGAAWGNVMIAQIIFEFAIAGVIMIAINTLETIKADFQKIRANLKLFFAQQFLEWGGYAGGSYAISVIPVTVVQGLTSTQPFFVLLYAVVLRKKLPEFFNEMVGRGDIIKKVILFGFSVVGTILVVTGGPGLFVE